MLNPTRHNLKKLENLARELGYTVRYEKGNFQSGYCLVEQKRVAIINKFFDIEARMNCLYDILSHYQVPEGEVTRMSKPSEKLWKELQPFLGISVLEEE